MIADIIHFFGILYIIHKNSWSQSNHALFAFCCCDKTLWPKATCVGKGLFCITALHHSLSLKEVRAASQGRKLKARIGAEAKKDFCLQSYSSGLALPASLQLPRPPAPGWHFPQWAEPSHIHHQSRIHTTGVLTVQSGGSIFQISVPSSQMHLICIKLT